MLSKPVMEVSDTDLHGGPLGLMLQHPWPGILEPGAASEEVLRYIRLLEGRIAATERLLSSEQAERDMQHSVVTGEITNLRRRVFELEKPKPGFWHRFLNWIRRK